MKYNIQHCREKKGYKINFENVEFSEIVKKIRKKAEIKLETPHFLIFDFKGKKISLTHSSLVIRSCNKKDAEKILLDLVNHNK